MNIVTIFICNSENKMLIQKRSKEKNGKYGITSGHVKENEKVEEAAIREVKEELGINVKKEELKLFYNTKIEDTTYNLYFLKKDIELNKLFLQKEEVENVNWLEKKEIEDLIQKNIFFEKQKEALDIFNSYFDGGINYGNNSSMGCK